MTRTFDPLQTSDLQEIRAYALDELERFLYRAGNPPGKFAHYQDRLIAICLCQGAAQHFVDLLPEDAFDTEIEVSNERIEICPFRTHSTVVKASTPNCRLWGSVIVSEIHARHDRRSGSFGVLIEPALFIRAQARQPGITSQAGSRGPASGEM